MSKFIVANKNGLRFNFAGKDHELKHGESVELDHNNPFIARMIDFGHLTAISEETADNLGVKDSESEVSEDLKPKRKQTKKGGK